MHRRPLGATLLTVIVASAALGLAAWAGAQPARPDRGREQLPSVEAAMRDMNRGMRQLRGALDDAARKDDNLRIINDIQRACLACKSQKVPQGLLRDAKDDAARAKLAVDYHAHLVTVMRTLLDLEMAVAQGKADEAKAKFTQLARDRDAGHEALGLGDDEEDKSDQGR